MKRLTMLLLCLLSFQVLYAQDQHYNSIELNWGVGNIKRQDLTFSPFIHETWSALNFALHFERSKRLEQMASVRFGQYSPQIGEDFRFNSYFNEETLDTYPHVFKMVDIQYGLGKNIIKKNSSSVSIGGKLRNQLNPSAYSFGNGGSFGYYFSFGLDLWVKLAYQVDENSQLKANVGVPFVSYNSRSPYMSQNDEYFEDNLSHNGLKTFVNYLKRGRFQSWGSTQSSDFDLAYNRKVSDRFNVGLKYRGSLIFNSDPRPLRSIENIVSLTATHKF